MIIAWYQTFSFLDNPEWVSAIGQLAGAIATFWAVVVALKQAKEARMAQQRAEMEAREALKPGLALSVKWDKDDNGKFTDFYFSATNVKRVPVYIDRAYIMYLHEGKWKLLPDKLIETDAPELVKYGDKCEIKVNFATLLDYMGGNDKQVFDVIFNTSLHEQYPVGVMIEHDVFADCTNVFLEAFPVHKEEVVSEWDEQVIRSSWMKEQQPYSKQMFSTDGHN